LNSFDCSSVAQSIFLAIVSIGLISSTLLYISLAICNGCVGSTNHLITVFQTAQSNHFCHISFQNCDAFCNHCGITVDNHKSAAHQATLDIFHNLLAVSVIQATFAHLLASQAHHCSNVKASLARPTGSSVIVFFNHSILPYLSITTCLPSGVIINLDKPIIVSKGFVIPLAVALAVFSNDQGALSIIIGYASVHSNSHSNGVQTSALFRLSFVTVGIFCTVSSISCVNFQTIFALSRYWFTGSSGSSIVHSRLAFQATHLLTPHCIGVCGVGFGLFATLCSFSYSCTDGRYSTAFFTTSSPCKSGFSCFTNLSNFSAFGKSTINHSGALLFRYDTIGSSVFAGVISLRLCCITLLSIG